jgi:hypothetical protein
VADLRALLLGLDLPLRFDAPDTVVGAGGETGALGFFVSTHAPGFVAVVNALPGLLDAADELRVLKAVRAARLQKMDEIVPQWRAACDAADSRAARAERERDDLAATLETRTAEHAAALRALSEARAVVDALDSERPVELKPLDWSAYLARNARS